MVESTNEETKVTSEPDVKDNQALKTEESKPKKRGRPPKIKDEKASENDESKNKDDKASENDESKNKDDKASEKKKSKKRKKKRNEIVQTAVTYMLEDLDKYFRDPTSKQVSKESIQYYIQRCCNLYINYSVIDKVITMTGLKHRIFGQNEYRSLSRAIRWAKRLILYHVILESNNEVEAFYKNDYKNVVDVTIKVINACGVNIAYDRAYEDAKDSGATFAEATIKAAEAAVNSITGINEAVNVAYNSIRNTGVLDGYNLTSDVVTGILFEVVKAATINTKYTPKAAMDAGATSKEIISIESAIASAVEATVKKVIENINTENKSRDVDCDKVKVNEKVEEEDEEDEEEDEGPIIYSFRWNTVTSNILNLFSFGTNGDQDTDENNNKFIQILNGERQINLGIHGDPSETEGMKCADIEKCLYLTLEEFLKLDSTYIYGKYGNNTDEVKHAEANLGNGIGSYEYNKNSAKLIDPTDHIYDYLLMEKDKEKQEENKEEENEEKQAMKENIHSDLKKLIFGSSTGHGLDAINFNPLGINNSIAFHYLIQNQNIEEILFEALDKLEEMNEKGDITVENGNDFDPGDELTEFMGLLWDVSFNPVSALGLIYDDNDGDAQNYSWRQNAYSLENIIGSVLDEMGRFSENFYDTDTYKRRDPQFVGYYKGMFENVGQLRDNIKRKKKNPSQKITRNNGKGNSKDYIFLYDGINDPAKYTKYTTPIEGNDYDLYGEEIELPDTLKIVLPLCIDLMDSELVEMIQALSLNYPHPITGIEGMIDYMIYIRNKREQAKTRKPRTKKGDNTTPTT